MTYPNDDCWKALADGEEILVRDKPYVLSVVECGDLVLPTGLLAVCDPFAMLRPAGNPTFQVPPGRYPVKVTLADVSGRRDGSHVREAYASLLLGEKPEATRRQLPLGFGVDAGAACFVDEGTLAEAMPPEEDWEEVIDDDSDGSWFSRMDDPNHIRDGLANVPLPFAKNGENIILIHSGWGDGHYGLVGSFDADDNLTAVHIDFKVIGAPETSDDPA